MGNVTPEEILEQQRAEATKVYADKVRSLQAQANELDAKCKNLKAALDEAFLNRQKELDGLADELRNKLAEVDGKGAEVAALMREVKSKEELTAKNLDEAVAKKKLYDDAVNAQVEAAQQEKDALSRRNDSCLIRETSSELKWQEASDRMAVALEKETDVNARISSLVSLQDEIKRSTQEQQELKLTNQKDLEEISKKLEDIEATKKDYAAKYTELIVLRDEVDGIRASLSQRKTELDTKEFDAKQVGIKNALEAQRNLDKQKDIDYQTGKLNELKNNVESLIKSQEANNKGA